MNPLNLTNKQLSELDSLFDLVSQRQKRDFGKINAPTIKKAALDGSPTISILFDLNS